MYLSGLLPLTLLGLASAGAVKRQSQSDPDFSGTGNIFVINGHDFATEDPNNIAGCITATGRFVSDTTKCGVFTAPSGKMSSTAGPCTFLDPTAEVGPPMAPQFYAFKCSPTSTQGNLFYSFLSGDPGAGKAWIWQGNLRQYYQAAGVPPKGVEAPIWSYNGERMSDSSTYFMWLWKKL